MVNKCCIPTCKTEWKPGHFVTFHKFPLRHPDLLKKWLDSIPNLDFTPGRHTVICGYHFTRDSFSNLHMTKIRLKRDAVPTLFGPDACSNNFKDVKPQLNHIYSYQIDSQEVDANFITVPEHEFSSSTNGEETNEEIGDTAVDVNPFLNCDSATNNEEGNNNDEASMNEDPINNEKILKTSSEKRKVHKVTHCVNASTQTMSRPIYRSLFLEKRAKQKIRILEKRLKRRKKMVLAVTDFLRKMVENW